MTTAFHAKFWAHSLRLSRHDGVDAISRSIGNARVDLNPHQVSAAVFAIQALRLGGPRGALLADEVGLGKTIEAGLVLAQYWAEGRRNLLLIVPAMLRNQWQAELTEKFALPAQVIDGTFAQPDSPTRDGRPVGRIWIVSYHFAARTPMLLSQQTWDLAILDEAHRMRGNNRGALMANAIASLLAHTPRVLLTATPLQNNLLELHSLGQLLDPHLFGDIDSFKQQFVKQPSEPVRNTLLRQRLQGVCVRTLRSQVQEYVRFTKRTAYTQTFIPTEDEHRLYEDVSEWLRSDRSVALPAGQRQLLTMVLRKLLASSSMAIAGALRKIIARVEDQFGVRKRVGGTEDADDLLDDFEADAELQELMSDGVPAPNTATTTTTLTLDDARAELRLLRSFADRAEHMARNTKCEALLLALGKGLASAAELGAANKAVVFTESRRTQSYLREVLESHGYSVVCISGSNRDQASLEIYRDWLKRHAHDGTISGVRNADQRAALVEHFRDMATVLLATEAASEGVNLQFCSLVVNYDLPWNPQRVEQRIGRCHRYGQKHDVVVVNFLNERNAADRRVLQLLTDKFLLFESVFGCSDEVLGAVGNGVDLERSIANIYQRCRTEDEIRDEFDALQAKLRPEIEHRLTATREQILSNFDEEVQAKLRVHRDQAKQMLDRRQGWLLDLLRWELAGSGNKRAHFADGDAALTVLTPPHAGRYHLDWRQALAQDAQHLGEDHPLAVACMDSAANRKLGPAHLHLRLPDGGRETRWEAYAGRSGWWATVLVTAEGLGGDDVLTTVCMTDAGEPLDAETTARMWALPADASAGELPPATFQPVLDAATDALQEDLRLQRAALLDDESDKLARWAEDEKLGLKLQLDRLDEHITNLQRQVRQVHRLDEKLELRRQERDLDRKRTELRRTLYEAQDRVDAERNRLLDALEEIVTGTMQSQVLMAGRWTLSGR